LRGLSQWVQLCTWSPNKLWRSNFKFNPRVLIINVPNTIILYIYYPMSKGAIVFLAHLFFRLVLFRYRMCLTFWTLTDTAWHNIARTVACNGCDFEKSFLQANCYVLTQIGKWLSTIFVIKLSCLKLWHSSYEGSNPHRHRSAILISLLGCFLLSV